MMVLQVLQQELSRRKGQGKTILKSWLRAVEMAELKAVNISNSKIQRCSKTSMCITERVKPAGGAQSMTRGSSPTPSSRPSRWFRYNLAGLAGYEPVQLAEELQPIWAAQEEEVLVSIYNAKVPLLLGVFHCDLTSRSPETKCGSPVCADRMPILHRCEELP